VAEIEPSAILRLLSFSIPWSFVIRTNGEAAFWAASSYCATGIDLFGILPLRSFSRAPGPIRTVRHGLSAAVGRYGHGRKLHAFPGEPCGSASASNRGVQGRGPLGLQ
jgi:hypothetical protein